MQNIPLKTFFKNLFLAVLLLAATVSAQAAPSKTVALMPRADDYTLMWWADGFPTRVPNAPWRRVTQTGRYALAVDTETLRIPHFGAVSSANYESAGLADNRAWQTLPPADLALRLTVNGKTYRAKTGGQYSTFGGPRLVESGRFLQRADVTGLVFTADDGTKLNVEARFETVAWADRLSLILAARPGWATIPAGEASFGRIRAVSGWMAPITWKFRTARNSTRLNLRWRHGPSCPPTIKPEARRRG